MAKLNRTNLPILVRRGLDADILATSNVVLEGELGYATDTKVLYIGNSSNVYEYLAGDVQGSDVASADEITIVRNGNYFDITGTTTINHINKTGWNSGNKFILQFDGSVTVTHNSGSPTGTEASIMLAGSVDFSATAGDTLTLVYDGVTFREVSRTII